MMSFRNYLKKITYGDKQRMTKTRKYGFEMRVLHG